MSNAEYPEGWFNPSSERAKLTRIGVPEVHRFKKPIATEYLFFKLINLLIVFRSIINLNNLFLGYYAFSSVK